MAQALPYVPTIDFSEYQAANPDAPFSGAALDVELLGIQQTTDGLRNNLALIQRDDGALVNGIVSPDSFNAAALALIGSGAFNVRGRWLTGTSFSLGDLVWFDAGGSDDGTYVCATDHTSGAFSTDLAAYKWVLLALEGAAISLPLSIANGGTGATNVAAARTALGLGSAALLAASALLASANNLNDVADVAISRANLGVVNFDIAGQTAVTEQLADADQLALYDASESALRKFGALTLASKNLLVNGAKQVWQFGATSLSRADDVYALDGWYVLTQTAAINVVRVDNPFDGARYASRLTQAQASAQRMGYAQIVETIDSVPERGRQVNLSGRIRCSVATKIRFAVVEWTGTADTVTSDIVNDWTTTTLTTGNFFLGSNLVIAGQGSIDVSAATWADITPLVVTPSAACNNLMVFFWTDTAQAQNVTLDFANTALREGAVALPFVAPTVQSEIARAQRSFCKSFQQSTAPAAALGAGSSEHFRFYCPSGVNSEPFYNWRFPVPMRIVPTVALFCPRAGGTAGQWTNNSAEGSNARALSPTTDGVIIDNGGVVPGTGTFEIGATADARL